MGKLFAQARFRRCAVRTGKSRRRSGLVPAAIAGALFAAACTEEQPLCEERTKRCLSIKTRDVRLGAQDRFEIQLTNVCHDEIEYKLCFEVHGEEADCRQGYLAATRRVDESISLARFGGRTRIFVRYESEAKACRFPLTRDVEF